jgi:glycosyltransferase involved in cell wall biosynthesis
VTVTFAVIGRNEAPTLRTSLGQALDAGEPGDRVVFVDGSSSDGSAEIARAMGVEVVPAGVGKGRAVAAAARAAGDGPLCTVDADIEWSERNIPAALREAYVRTGADLVVGDFVQQARLRTLTPGLYRPLVGALFPEVLDAAGPTPITGFRAIGPGRMPRRLPTGYGVETFLNIRFVLDGLHMEAIELGLYDGPLKAYSNIERIATDMLETILDLAIAERRLSASMRPAWEGWAEAIVDHARSLPVAPSGRDAFEDRLMELAARPLPATRPAVLP